MKKLFTIIVSAIILTVSAFALTGCGGGFTPPPTATPKAVPTAVPEATLNPQLLENTIPIEIDFEDGSVIKADLYPDIAPITVANFVKLAKEGFYDGLIFHRVIEDFMIQGGGFTTDFEQKETDSIKGEFSANGVENNLKHDRGVLSMARTNVPDSASSQFFIMHQNYPSLDGKYAAFGKVTEGMDVVDKIAAAETTSLSNGMDDVPVDPPVIKTIKVLD